ncbi:serine/threonine-protein kinase TOR-like [Salvia splendens]|uniref:serine/threonine-protein kinase TOR-like n=1 Tax=Salvia splendens TaxID=180675 RepID=UPI001C26ED6D|nr:serine/threonine-protein kinase TOR-like [Salvia splendens]
MYPLLVACKSISNLRREAAQEVVDKVRQHSGILVDEAQLVSTELIRVAILWHEMWHEGLEEASRLYFGEHNIEGMLNVLEPLHRMLEEGAARNISTIKEKAFIQAYRHELLEAYECCMRYRRTGNDADLTQAWNLYYHVFRRIDKQLQSLTTLDLQSVSPELLECRNLKLAVLGTYIADSPVVTIASFAPQLVVITSKQRPRKLTIHGSDGEEHAFLLKGHEDLRQDERVMQLFGLVNTLLGNSRKTAEKDLSIQRYSVIPLSPNSGIIGWVPNCDTLHHLIREYRDARKITLNQEHKLMLGFAPDYDHLPLIAKVEVFDYALQNTEGNDLSRVLWLKSRTSEVWLDRRTNYTRSLAVISMVGYLLGLGDRHPSNLILHRFSGKILHIDFGDCFEASMNREKFPEKVPFRLTRMLVKAMEVSGIEGNFRSTCESVMQVLRTNKDSVMAMMEAFVHDPLINWRLFNLNEVPQISTLTSSMHAQPAVNEEESISNREMLQPQRGVRERELLQAVNQLGDANEVLNERAVVVMARMSNKLTGRDFSSIPSSSIQHSLEHGTLISGDTHEADHGLSVKLQVQKLILQAMSHENLCQNYVGWCPFW